LTYKGAVELLSGHRYPNAEWTLVHIAAFENIPETILSLVTGHNLPVDVLDLNGNSPLIIATQCQNMDAMHALLMVGAAVNLKSAVDGRTALHYAANKIGVGNSCKMIQILLDAGADVNALDDINETPLHESCFVGNAQHAVCLLLQYGAKVDTKNNDGDTPLHFACNQGYNIAVAAMLINLGASPYVVNESNDSPFHLASDAVDEDYADKMVRMIHEYFPGIDMSFQDDDGNTMLHKTGYNATLFEWLTGVGACISRVNDEGNTPLHALADYNHAFEHTERGMQVRNCIRILLSMNAPLDAQNKERLTPSNIATRAGRHDIAVLLDTEVCKPKSLLRKSKTFLGR
jgi:ankyrin repeat protein